MRLKTEDRNLVIKAEIIAHRSGKFIYSEIQDKLNLRYYQARAIRDRLEKEKVIDSKLNVIQLNLCKGDK